MRIKRINRSQSFLTGESPCARGANACGALRSMAAAEGPVLPIDELSYAESS